MGWKTIATYLPESATMEVRYRPVGTEEWTVKEFTITGRTGSAWNATYSLDLPPGQYEYQTRYISSTQANTTVSTNGCATSGFVPTTYQLTGNSVDRIGVALYFPKGLYQVSNSGKLENYSATIRVEYRKLGASDLEWIGETITITAATQSIVRRIIEFKYLERAKYEVRAYYTNAPKNDERHKAEAWMEFIQEGIKDDFRYPGSSLFALRALATDQLQGSLPTVTLVATRDYLLVWNGTEYIEVPASNPAWACYDMLHNDRYGGGVEKERINYAEFKAWADWCDEREYTFCMYFDAATSLAEAINHASTCGRGMVIQRGTDFGCIVDRPAEPVQMFNMQNIVEDTFEEIFTQKNERANCLEITFYDKEKSWEQTVIEVRDTSFDETLDPIIRTSITLYGCESEVQAFAYGRFLLNQNRHLLRTVSFSADIDAIACQVGDVILLQHDLPEWGLGSGRVRGAGLNSITLEDEIELKAGDKYAIIVRHQEDDLLETRTIKAVTEDTTTSLVEVETPFSKVPMLDSLYTIGYVESVAKKFRVIKLTKSQDFQRKITCVEYRDDIYADIGEVLQTTQNDSNLVDVKDLAATEIWKPDGANSGSSLAHLSWRGSAMSWNISYRQANSSAWIQAGKSSVPEFYIEGLELGVTYYVAVSATNNPEDGEITSIPMMGKAAPPNNVEVLYASQMGDNVVLQWPHIPDGDLYGYIIKEGPSWEKGKKVSELCQDNRFVWSPPDSGKFTIWIKAVDTSHLESQAATSRTIDVSISTNNEIARLDEITLPVPCEGSSSDDFIFSPHTGRLHLISGMTDTDCPDFTDEDIAFYMGDTKLNENFYITKAYDLGSVTDFTLRATAQFESLIRNPTDEVIKDRVDSTFPMDTDDHITSYATYAVYYRTSQDGAAWSDWQSFDSLIKCHARFYQLRYEAQMDTYSTSFEFESIVGACDGPDVELSRYDEEVPLEGKVIKFSDIGITIFLQYSVSTTVVGNAAVNCVVEKQPDQFTIRLFDPSGNAVTGIVDYTIRGV